jgi:S-adenosylmethionine:tRNA ribosyltransferase-isomerase
MVRKAPCFASYGKYILCINPFGIIMNMDELNLKNYEYGLPKELIAQRPLEKRDNSRLLVLNRMDGSIQHKKYSEIIDYLNPGDCLVLNRTKVVPARLLGKKETGGKVEALFLNPVELKEGENARALLKPFMDIGKKIIFHGGLRATVESKTDRGETMLKLEGADPQETLREFGKMPLPPYIKRPGEGDGLASFDREHYQTVYAEENGSIAAPTAGLHFTPELINKITEKGIKVAKVVLHVGWGTFKPLVSEDISKHVMLPESYELSPETSETLNAVRKSGGRIVAVGTTSVRALESAALNDMFDKQGFLPEKKETSIFIYPGHKFKVVDAMATNFHLPCSTPLVMVCALAGRSKILAAYAEAIKEKYRFFSYGDAMLIL